MIRRLVLLTLVVFVPSVVFAQGNRDAIAKQLEANERVLSVAIQKGDLAGFKALVDDVFLITANASNNWPMPTRREFLSMAVAVSGSTVLWPSHNAGAPADFAFVSAIDAARAIREGKVTSLELTRHMFDRIERYRSLNAVVTLMREEALARAQAADDARAKRQNWGPLHGVPCTIKDAFETRGVRVTAGALKDYIPTQDAAVVERLRAAGAILLGMTNVPPMLADYQSDNPIFGRSNNPWDPARTPGGSTGGGAASLAAGLGYLTIGSDIAGSIRVPAHFCGVYGHRPSHGVVPERGHIPPLPGDRPAPATGLNVVGSLARSAEDLKLARRSSAAPTSTHRLPTNGRCHLRARRTSRSTVSVT